MPHYIKYELISYRDAESDQYLYYWISSRGLVSSPYFYSEADANDYLKAMFAEFDKRKMELLAK